MDLFAKGWECPKCGAVMSPTTSVCVNCRGVSETSINTHYTPTETDCKNYPPYLDRPKGLNFQKEKGGE